MTENVIELKATHKGLAGRYITHVAWVIIAFVAILFLNSFTNNVMGKYDACDTEAYSSNCDESKKVTSFLEYHKIRYTESNDDGKLLLAGIGMIIFGIIYICNAKGVIDDYYTSKTRYVIDKGSGKITEVLFRFPLAKDEKEVRFDRIIKVEIEQGNINRINNSGNVVLHFITYANADTISGRFNVAYISDPRRTADMIMEGIQDYSGLKVKMAG